MLCYLVRKKMKWKTVLLLLLFAFLCHCTQSGSRKHLVKRHLVFNKGSKFFLAVDVRDNLFRYSDFFAEVFGVKMEWNLPDGVIHNSNQGRLHRRHIYQGIEYLLGQYDLNGRSCIQKFTCEAFRFLPKSDLFLAQLYEIVFASKDEDPTNVSNKTQKGCEEVVEECPLSLLSTVVPNFKNYVIN